MKSSIPPGLGPKLGRNRPVAIGPHFRLRNYLRASLPAPPPSADFSGPGRASLVDVYGNDLLGCCIVSALYHLVGVVTGNAGALFSATLDQIIRDYSAIGDYVPGRPETDQGCDEVTALNYVQQHGFANGTKALGWLTVDATNQREVQSAISLFEGALLTLELPGKYVAPYPSGDGFTWDVGTPNPQNGHGIMSPGYDSRGLLVVTWGMIGTFTYAALAELCTASAGGGLYLVLTPDLLAKGAAKAPNGLAWNDLIADWDTMGGTVPIPPPPAPPPPVAGAPVTLAEAEAWALGALHTARPLLTRSQASAIVQDALASNWRGT